MAARRGGVTYKDKEQIRQFPLAESYNFNHFSGVIDFIDRIRGLRNFERAQFEFFEYDSYGDEDLPVPPMHNRKFYLTVGPVMTPDMLKYTMMDDDLERKIIARDFKPSQHFLDALFIMIKRGDYESARKYFVAELMRRPQTGGLVRRITFMDDENLDKIHWYMNVEKPGMFDLYYIMRQNKQRLAELDESADDPRTVFEKLFISTDKPAHVPENISLAQHYASTYNYLQNYYWGYLSFGGTAPDEREKPWPFTTVGDFNQLYHPVDPHFGHLYYPANMNRPDSPYHREVRDRKLGFGNMFALSFDIYNPFKRSMSLLDAGWVLGRYEESRLWNPEKFSSRSYFLPEYHKQFAEGVINTLRQLKDQIVYLGAPDNWGDGVWLEIYDTVRDVEPGTDAPFYHELYSDDPPSKKESQDVVIPSLAELAEHALEGQELNQLTIPGSFRLGKQEATTPVEYYSDDVAGPLTDRQTEEAVLRRIRERRREREMQARKAGQVEELAEMARDAERQRLRNLLEEQRTQVEELESEYKRLLKRITNVRLREGDPGDLLDQEIDLFKRRKEAEIAVAETESALKGGFGEDELRLIESKQTLRHFEILADQLKRTTDPDERQQIRDAIFQNWPDVLKYDWRYKLYADRESRLSQQEIPVAWRTDPRRTALEAAQRRRLEDTAREGEQSRFTLKRRAETPVDVEDVEEPEERRQRTEAQIRWALSQVANDDVEAAAALLRNMKF